MTTSNEEAPRSSSVEDALPDLAYVRALVSAARAVTNGRHFGSTEAMAQAFGHLESALDNMEVKLGEPITKCPSCGGCVLQVQIKTMAAVRFTEDGGHCLQDVFGDIEWDGMSLAECTQCGHRGALLEFETYDAP